MFVLLLMVAKDAQLILLLLSGMNLFLLVLVLLLKLIHQVLRYIVVFLFLSAAHL